MYFRVTPDTYTSPSAWNRVIEYNNRANAFTMYSQKQSPTAEIETSIQTWSMMSSRRSARRGQRAIWQQIKSAIRIRIGGL